MEGPEPKYYINNPSSLIETAVSSGGVEVIDEINHTVRLSISPSQGSFSQKQQQETTIPGSDVTNSGRRITWAERSIRDIIEGNDFWISFNRYLQGFNGPKTISSRLSYARRYYYLLISRNFSELHELSKEIRNHVMKALASLSKYLGIYDKWKEIVRIYNLKWSSGFNGLDAFKKIISSDNDLESMLKSVKDTLSEEVVPIGYRNLIIFSLLTGLRAAESVESIKILKNDTLRQKYLSLDQPIIKHYEFPDTFIRSTKKAYISIVNKDLINLALSCPVVNLDNFRSFFTKRKIPLHMNYCRKIFATYLRNRGIESEIIDLLQGRIPQSVFLRHYYRPNINYERIGEILVDMKMLIL